jgi:hypothetical protein
MINVQASIAELVGRFERDRGEYLHVCYDGLPKSVAVPISPTLEQHRRSMLTKEEYAEWFQQNWNITGASTREHPAPFPLELAHRLVRMFSFQGDTVLDPFCGTGTTMLAAIKTGRSSIGVEIDPAYRQMALRRLERETRSLFSGVEVTFTPAAETEPYPAPRPERIAAFCGAA